MGPRLVARKKTARAHRFHEKNTHAPFGAVAVLIFCDPRLACTALVQDAGLLLAALWIPGASLLRATNVRPATTRGWDRDPRARTGTSARADAWGIRPKPGTRRVAPSVAVTRGAPSVAAYMIRRRFPKCVLCGEEWGGRADRPRGCTLRKKRRFDELTDDTSTSRYFQQKGSRYWVYYLRQILRYFVHFVHTFYVPSHRRNHHRPPHEVRHRVSKIHDFHELRGVEELRRGFGVRIRFIFFSIETGQVRNSRHRLKRVLVFSFVTVRKKKVTPSVR